LVDIGYFGHLASHPCTTLQSYIQGG